MRDDRMGAKHISWDDVGTVGSNKGCDGRKGQKKVGVEKDESV